MAKDQVVGGFVRLFGTTVEKGVQTFFEGCLPGTAMTETFCMQDHSLEHDY